MLAPTIVDPSVEAFKERTRSKLRNVLCPSHRQTPRVKFEGHTLREVRVSMSACCDDLMRLANKAIAS